MNSWESIRVGTACLWDKKEQKTVLFKNKASRPAWATRSMEYVIETRCFIHLMVKVSPITPFRMFCIDTFISRYNHLFIQNLFVMGGFSDFA